MDSPIRMISLCAIRAGQASVRFFCSRSVVSSFASPFTAPMENWTDNIGGLHCQFPQRHFRVALSGETCAPSRS